MSRGERSTLKTSPRFDVVVRRRWWHELPGMIGIAAGLALWAFVAFGVLAPLADAIARLHSPAPAPAPQASCPDADEEPTFEGVDRTVAQPRVCVSPERGGGPVTPAGG